MNTNNTENTQNNLPETSQGNNIERERERERERDDFEEKGLETGQKKH